jgi:lipoprotein-releasing system ATP-binding protein
MNKTIKKENTSSVVMTRGLQKTFQTGGGEALTIFRDINLSVAPGEIVALVGQSGSGKSTLLQIVGLLDRPTEGQILIEGRDVTGLDDGARTKLRRDTIGFVYQFHHLLPEFTALENVMLPQMIAGQPRAQAMTRATSYLNMIGLGHRLNHRPARLSGGEQQRVAIVRALVNNPRLLLADEPTGNLDQETSQIVFDMLVKLVRQSGVGALIATHNLDLADKMDRIIELKQGRIFSY